MGGLHGYYPGMEIFLEMLEMLEMLELELPSDRHIREVMEEEALVSWQESDVGP